jgi:hypothetical protein
MHVDLWMQTKKPRFKKTKRSTKTQQTIDLSQEQKKTTKINKTKKKKKKV